MSYLSILPEVIPLAQFLLFLCGKRLEIATPTGAEINLPSPEASDEGLGIFVILNP